MSATRHAVVRGPRRTGRGYVPDLTPAHQVDLETGYTWRIAGRRMKPIAGMSLDVTMAYPCLGYSLIRFWTWPLIRLTLMTTIRL